MKPSRVRAWSVAVGVTGAVHGTLIWAAVSAWSGGPTHVWVEPPAIELVAIQGGETSVEKGQDKPAPEPLPDERKPPTPPAPTPASFVHPPVPMAPVPTFLPVAAPAPAAAAPSSAPAPPAPSPAPPAPPKAAPAPPAPPQRAGDAVGLNVNAPRGKSQDYGSILRVWLEAHKTYPRHAKMRRQEGAVTVRFSVDRGGNLLERAIVRSSGVASLDEEALAAIARSNPFPAAPGAVGGQRFEKETILEFYLR